MDNLIKNILGGNEKIDLEDNEDHNWRVNAPYLYDKLFIEEVNEPLLSLEFSDYFEYNNDYSYLRLITGTNAYEGDQNYLYSYKIKIPKDRMLKDKESMRNFKCLEEEFKIKHDGEVNKLKINPYNKHIIATKTNFGTINLFNTFKINEENEPISILPAENEMGFGLNWFENKEGYLVSGGTDGILSLFDIDNQKSKLIEYTFDCAINDVIPDKLNSNLLYICKENGELSIFDIRDKKINNTINLNDEIYSIDMNKNQEKQFIVGSAKGKLELIDFRFNNLVLNSFDSHNDDILKVQFANYKNGIFSSISKDKKVCIWDIFKIGDDLEEDNNSEVLPTELLFQHNGHDNIVTDFCWSNNMPKLCASCSEEDNILQIWAMTDEL